jgi:hypothetical protein
VYSWSFVDGKVLDFAHGQTYHRGGHCTTAHSNWRDVLANDHRRIEAQNNFLGGLRYHESG